MYTLGIDIGSASSKAVILKDGAEITASAVIQARTALRGPAALWMNFLEILIWNLRIWILPWLQVTDGFL